MPYEQIWEIKQTAHVLGSMFAVLETLRKPQDPSRPSNSYLFLFNKLPMTVGVLVQKYAQTHTHLAPRSRIIVNHVCDVGCTLQRRWSRIRSGCIKLPLRASLGIGFASRSMPVCLLLGCTHCSMLATTAEQMSLTWHLRNSI